jgi:hypothetical protein
MKNKLITIIFILAPFLSSAQASKQDSLWLPFRNFIGKWKGTSEGEPGNGVYERTYKFIFNKKFIEVKNRSTYPPSKERPDGEVHEDVGYISYDKIRKTFVLRQFHIEGFVNQYKLDTISPDRKMIVFVSENIENIPPGWKARETYELINDNELTEVFDLAAPGKDFELYSKASLKKEK